MKKFLLIAALFSIALSVPASAQRAMYKVSNPSMNVSGSFTQPSQYITTGATGPQIFPWDTAGDTLHTSGADTFKCKITGPHESVYTWIHQTNVSGTAASVYKLWASADSGKGVDFVQVYSVSAAYNATNPVGTYLFNSTGGWPYTNFFWSVAGGSGDTTVWRSGVMPR